MGYDQIPQLTSSRLIDVNKTMYIVPPEFKSGRRRAVLIGINYVGQQVNTWTAETNESTFLLTTPDRTSRVPLTTTTHYSSTGTIVGLPQ